MTAIRKGKNGGSSFEEGARSAKPKNAVGFRFVQRKFAQGAPLPPPQPMAASPAAERRPEPPKEDQKTVYHSRMSASNLLDVIALQNQLESEASVATFVKLYLREIHPHAPPGGQQPQQPKVLLERLRGDEMPGPSAPGPPPPPPPPHPLVRLEHHRPDLRAKFKKRMCLRPRPGMALNPGPITTVTTMRPPGIQPGMVREARMSTVSSVMSTTEDDLPLLYLRKEPSAEDVDMTDTESNFNFDFKRPQRPLRPATFKTRKIRRTREVTPMPWLLLRATEQPTGQPRRSTRRPCPRLFPTPAQRPGKRGDYALLDPIGEAPSEEAEEAIVNFANRLNSKCCSSTAFKSVHTIVRGTAAKSVLLNRRCRKCDRCGIIKKIIKLSGLIQAAYRKRVPVNDSNSDENRARQILTQMRVTRPGQTQAWVFLDIFPKTFPKGLKIEYMPVGDDKMDATVYIVDRWAMMDTSDVSFMEQQNVINNLLEHMEKPVEGQGVQEDLKLQVEHGQEAPVEHGQEAPVEHGQEAPVEHGQEAPVDHSINEPRPSTSRANVNVGAERKRDPKRKRVEPDVNQPSTSRANVGTERRPKRRRNEAHQNPVVRRQFRARKANANTRRPASRYPAALRQLNLQTQMKDSNVAVTLSTPGDDSILSQIMVAPTYCPSEEEFRPCSSGRPAPTSMPALRCVGKISWLLFYLFFVIKGLYKFRPISAILDSYIEILAFGSDFKSYSSSMAHLLGSSDPIAYFKKLEEKASEFGICKVVPPASFKPPCKLLGNNRFSVVYQYISKLYNRWGPGSRELAAIKAYLWLQNFTIRRPPIMECSEINLPKLHHVVERYGGANKVVKYKRWGRVAEEMNLRQVRTSERRLDQVFIQYLLPYASLSLDERQKKIASVENGWTKKYQRIVKKAHKPFHKQERLLGEAVSSEEETELPEVVVALREAEDCIVPGRAMNLTVFKKVAETLRDNHFDRNRVPSIEEIEAAYWRAVMQGDDHIVANAASIDTGDEGYGFPKYEGDGYSLHPYNLKMIAKHPDNVLRFLGDLLGANNPTLHLNMLFSTSCWHRDPHRLPWVEYSHKGEAKIWYGIPDSESENFRRAVQRLCPAFCQNKPIWLASDIAMIPPDTLINHNVKLTRTVQMPGEYILVFPKAHSCSIATGFSVSESVYFATLDWLESAPALFKGLRDCCEPSMFSLEQLLINGVSDPNTPRHLLLPMCSVLSTLISDELENRRLLALKGLKIDEPLAPKRGPSRRGWNNAPECEFCRCTLFLSGVVGLTGKRGAFCTEHALKLLDCGKYSHIEVPELEFRSNFKNVELEQIIKKTEARVVNGV